MARPAFLAILNQIADLGVEPSSVRMQPLRGRPELVVTMATRTDYELVVRDMRLKSVERKYPLRGQRQWWAERDTDDLGLLVQVVSFSHHEDWQPPGGDEGNPQEQPAGESP